jgi:hypothetical protein
MYAIVGSGFGLYGYLPAIVESLGERVVLPRAYEAKILARAELAPLASRVDWADDMRAALARADTVVIATPPARQLEVARQCLELANVRRILLEKPPAPSPAEAAALLDELRRHAKRYRIGFTLLHAHWHPAMRWPSTADHVDLTWTFMAHHFAHGARQLEAAALRGRRRVALLRNPRLRLPRHARVRRTCAIRRSRERPRTSRGAGARPSWALGVPPCHVRVDSAAPVSGFRIEARALERVTPLIVLADPFAAEPALGAHDRRVGALERLLASFDEDDGPWYSLYERVNRLWTKAEA